MDEILIVNKINHSTTFYLFVNDLEYEFKIVEGEIKSSWLPKKYYEQIKEQLEL